MELDLEWHPPRPGINQQIDLLPSSRPPEIGLAAGPRPLIRRHHLIDDEGFPTQPSGRMCMQDVRRVDAQERVQQAGISKVDLGALHQPLLDVREEWRQLPDEKRLLEDVHIPVHRMVADTERAGELRRIPQAAVSMRLAAPVG